MAAKTKKCPACGGNGKGPDLTDKGRKSLFQKHEPCVVCKGKGKVKRFWS